LGIIGDDWTGGSASGQAPETTAPETACSLDPYDDPMPEPPTPPPEPPESLRRTIADLERAVHEMQAERDRQVRRRRRQLISTGIAISLVVHLAIMILLTTLSRGSRGTGQGNQPVSYEFAIVPEEDLTSLARSEFDDLDEPLSEIEEPPEASIDFAAETTAPQLEMTGSGAVPSLGGSAGGGAVQGLSGGGAGTSFFGISSSGVRFAYIIDISGSMDQGRKMPTAMRELRKSLDALPDYAYFYVVLFSSNYVLPPGQVGWKRARRTSVNSLVRWLEDVNPKGGTEPQTSFDHVLALDVRPDVIFFLTDGIIPNMTAEFVSSRNRRGKPVVINTIAFGQEGSQDLLARMARESGGEYREVPIQ
jgi:hypothetical protein